MVVRGTALKPQDHSPIAHSAPQKAVYHLHCPLMSAMAFVRQVVCNGLGQNPRGVGLLAGEAPEFQVLLRRPTCYHDVTCASSPDTERTSTPNETQLRANHFATWITGAPSCPSQAGANLCPMNDHVSSADTECSFAYAAAAKRKAEAFNVA